MAEEGDTATASKEALNITEDMNTTENEVLNDEFTEVKGDDGTVTFSCNQCSYKNPKSNNTKNHIKRVHAKKDENKSVKRKERDPDDPKNTPRAKKDKKSDKKTSTIVEGLEKTFQSTQMSSTDQELLLAEIARMTSEEEKTDDKDDTDEEEEDKTDDDTIHAGNLDTKELETTIEEQKSTIKTLQGIINNHEEEKKAADKEKKTLIENMTNIMNLSKKLTKERDDLKKQIKEDKAGGSDAKLKKELKKSEKRKDELIKEVEDLKVEITKKDVELTTQRKTTELLQNVLDNTAANDTRKEKCKLFERGSCPYNERCRHVHPKKECQEFSRDKQCNKRQCMELHKSDPEQDCKFWMQGYCKFESSQCGRGAHDKDKFNTRKREPSKVEMMNMMQEMMKNQKSNQPMINLNQQPTNMNMTMQQQPMLNQQQMMMENMKQQHMNQQLLNQQNMNLQNVNQQNMNMQNMNQPNMNQMSMNMQNINQQSMNQQNMNMQNINQQSMNQQNMNQQNMNMQNINQQNMNQQNMNQQNMNLVNMNQQNMNLLIMNQQNMNQQQVGFGSQPDARSGFGPSSQQQTWGAGGLAERMEVGGQGAQPGQFRQ